MSINTKSGFTIVEMMVVIPMALLVLSGIVFMAVRMTNSAALSNEKTNRITALNTALDMIEQDIAMSNAFLVKPLLTDYDSRPNTDFLDLNDTNSPQLKNSVIKGIFPIYDPADEPKPPFSNKQPRLILNRLATTTNPNAEDIIKKLVHFKKGPFYDQDELCAYNPPVIFNVVYYVSGDSLYRRVIIPYSKTNRKIDLNIFCHWTDSHGNLQREIPWQLPTCNKQDFSSGAFSDYCKAEDQLLLRHVDFQVEYYDSNNNPISSNQVYNRSASDEDIQDLLDKSAGVRVSLVSKFSIVAGEAETVVSGNIVVNRLSSSNNL